MIINFDTVTFFYPDAKIPALEGINLSIEQGEFLAVMGETGSGKTTVCKLINGIIPHLLGGGEFTTLRREEDAVLATLY